MFSSPAFTFTTTAEEVADAFSSGIRGKNGTNFKYLNGLLIIMTVLVLITGTSLNGIGFAASRKVRHVFLAGNCQAHCTSPHPRLKLSQEAIKREFPDAHVRRLVLDLGSLGGVRKAAAEVNAYYLRLRIFSRGKSENGENGLVGRSWEPFIWPRSFVTLRSLCFPQAT
ncbi:hypothetical protein B0H11DRAFT_1899469 [Mycena galericulata]|nr:hypothetical protein B0H11DRAFT_1899469 [Mycena galericulata]